MTVDAHHIISLSIRKIQGSRSRRGGPDLCKNLLVSNVLHKAKRVFIQRQKSVDELDQEDEPEEVDEEDDDEDAKEEDEGSQEEDDNQAPVDEEFLDEIEDDSSLQPPSQVPPQNLLQHFLPDGAARLSDSTPMLEDASVGGDFHGLSFSAEDDDSSSSSSGDSMEEDEEDDAHQSIDAFAERIDPRSVLVSVYNDPSLHPGPDVSEAILLPADASSCHHHPDLNRHPCHQVSQGVEDAVGPTIDHMTPFGDASSWTASLKRRRMPSEDEDDDVELEVSMETDAQHDKRLRLDSTYECGYYSRVAANSSAENVQAHERFERHDVASISEPAPHIHPLPVLSIPSSVLAVEDFQSAQLVVPSVHSITGARLTEHDATSPRNLASMLTPLKCVVTPEEAVVVVGATSPFQRKTCDSEGTKDEAESGAQISSLVSRFSSGFSGLAAQQQQLKTLAAAAAATSVGQQQVQHQQPLQQQTGTIGADSSVTICSALIKESFDVLSRPSLLAMSV